MARTAEASVGKLFIVERLECVANKFEGPSTSRFSVVFGKKVQTDTRRSAGLHLRTLLAHVIRTFHWNFFSLRVNPDVNGQVCWVQRWGGARRTGRTSLGREEGSLGSVRFQGPLSSVIHVRIVPVVPSCQSSFSSDGDGVPPRHLCFASTPTPLRVNCADLSELLEHFFGGSRHLLRG